MTSIEWDEPIAAAREAREIGAEGPEAEALSDAEQVVERARLDEEAAGRARDEYRERGLPAITTDEAIRSQLRADELVHACRTTAILEITPPNGPEGSTLRGGTLYLTSDRLVHTAESGVTWVPLDQILEMGVAIERLVVLQLQDGTGIAIEADQPRLLRVQIAAAMAAERASAHRASAQRASR